MDENDKKSYLFRVLADVERQQKTAEFQNKMRVGRFQAASMIGIGMPVWLIFKFFHLPVEVLSGFFVVLCFFTFAWIPQIINKNNRK